MVRLILPPGNVWTYGSGESLTGPYELVSNQASLVLTPGGSPEVKTWGEWTLHSDNTWYQTLGYTREEMAQLPTIWAMVLCVICLWLRRLFVFALFCGTLNAAVFKLDGGSTTVTKGTGTNVTLYRMLPNGTLQSGAGTLSYTLNGTEATVSWGQNLTSYSCYYVIVWGSSYDPAKALKWLDPYEVGSPTEPQTNDTGPIVAGQPQDGNGNPISDPTNPVAAPVLSEAEANVVNDTGVPGRPTIRVTPRDGSPAYDVPWNGPAIQPGQSAGMNISSDKPFDWAVKEWDVGDGQSVGPGSSPQGGGSTPGGSGSGATSVASPATTPALTAPALGPSGDTAAAVNRHAAMTATYGEAARTAANIANNNLDKLKELFGDALESIEGQGEMGEDQLAALEDIRDNTDGVTPPTINEPSDITTHSPLTSQVQQIRDGMARAGDSLNNVVAALGLGNSIGVSQLVFNIPFGYFGTMTLDLEMFAGVLDFIRSLMLGVISVLFVGRFLKTIRDSLVG